MWYYAKNERKKKNHIEHWARDWARDELGQADWEWKSGRARAREIVATAHSQKAINLMKLIILSTRCIFFVDDVLSTNSSVCRHHFATINIWWCEYNSEAAIRSQRYATLPHRHIASNQSSENIVCWCVFFSFSLFCCCCCLLAFFSKLILKRNRRLIFEIPAKWLNERKTFYSTDGFRGFLITCGQIVTFHAMNIFGRFLLFLP